MIFAMDSWYTYTIIIEARNQHTASGTYEFHIHRAYVIYGYIHHYKRLYFYRALIIDNISHLSGLTTRNNEGS